MPKNPRDEIEELAGAWLPGDGDPEDHPYDELLEHVAPSHGVIRRRLERARKAHREAEANPDKGAVHLGREPIPDMGGVTAPAHPRNLTGTFVPVPPDELRPPMTGGRKMRVQSFEEARAEIAEGRAEIAREKATVARDMVSHARALAEQEAELLEQEAELLEREARHARRDAEPSGF
jgi:hypothetical protein